MFIKRVLSLLLTVALILPCASFTFTANAKSEEIWDGSVATAFAGGRRHAGKAV